MSELNCGGDGGGSMLMDWRFGNAQSRLCLLAISGSPLLMERIMFTSAFLRVNQVLFCEQRLVTGMLD